MKKVIRKSAILLGVVASLSQATASWRPLFNGATFAGWHIAGATTYWTINAADSAIVGYSTTSTPYTMVFSDSIFDQFTIKYSYRLMAGCSGFFFRSVENTTTERVAGVQIEAKFTGGRQSEVGSLYDHPSPGWVVQHSQSYSDRIARTPSTTYQDVVLTVRLPYVYVNVNGYQAVGETNTAELALGARAAWRYDAAPIIVNPGRFGLQIHGGQPQMDVRFKRISVLMGCGNAASPNYDGNFVAGLPTPAGAPVPQHPAVYQDNGTCTGTGIDAKSRAAAEAAGYLGRVERMGSEWVMPVRTPGAHSFELVSLRGQIVFSASHPSAKDYHITVPARPGVYVAKVTTKTASVARKIVVP